MVALSGNIGTDGNDTLQGTSAADLLSGLGGNDSISGLSGNDTIFGDGGDDTIRGGSGNDSISGGDGADRIIDTTGSNVIDGGAGDDFINAGDRSQTVNGGDGNDEIHVLVFAPGGTTIVDGGDGNDTLDGYVFDDGAVSLTGGAGVDLFDFQVVSNVPGNVVITDFTAGAGGDVFDLANILYDMSGYDGGNPFAEGLVRVIQGDHKAELQVLSGGVFQTVIDLANVDVSALTAENFRGFTFDGSHLAGQTFNGTGDGDTLLGTIGDDTLNGLGGDDSLFGDNGADLIDGGDGNDTLNGYLGLNTLIGGAGDDSLVSVDGANTLYGGDGADVLDISGNARQFADGGSGNDTFSGGLNSHQTTLTGGSGADTYQFSWVNSGAYATITDFTAGSGGDVVLLDDLINGQLSGDVGNPFTDGYMRLVQSGSDVLLQVDADGASSPFSSFETYFVFQNTVLEQFTAYNFGGYAPFPSPVPTSGNDSITGTAGGDLIAALEGNDTLRGLGGNDTLDGGTGDDSMYGGAGNDVYYVDSADDVVSETTSSGNDDGGADRVFSSIDYMLGAYVENLNLTGSSNLDGMGNGLNNGINGNAGNNHLWGLGGNDVMNGGAGADTMYGGSGDDTYIVDNAGDVASEESAGVGLNDGGADTVLASVSYAIGSFIEDLTLTGSANIDGTGNGLNNVINGNAGANALWGLDGSDRLNGNGGSDTLYGGAGNDTLTGGDGIDTLYGGANNDTYYVDNTGDVASEQSTAGIDDGGTEDRVYASVSYTIGTFIEQLTLTGVANLSGTGNGGDNTITGNTGNNLLSGMGGADSLLGADGLDTLYGGQGNDTLDGGLGADTMYGGAGNDIYYVDSASDVVSEESTGPGINDGGGDRVMSSVDFTLGNFVEHLNLLGGANLNGTGNGLANGLNGNSGNNSLSGLGGVDTLNGGNGDDTLAGGQGNDVLNGGAGADTFAFAAAGIANGVDTVQDFVHGTDALLFTGADYGFTAGHVLTASEFTNGTSAVGSSAQFVWDAATHTLYWDHDGAGGDAAVAIATFNCGATVTASDVHFG